jgi:hypothetical protein
MLVLPIKVTDYSLGWVDIDLWGFPSSNGEPYFKRALKSKGVKSFKVSLNEGVTIEYLLTFPSSFVRRCAKAYLEDKSIKVSTLKETDDGDYL